MTYRKLRIAWSVAWGVVAVLLIVLWAYSNVSVDKFALPVTQATYFKFGLFPNEFYVEVDDRGLDNGTWHEYASVDDWLPEYFAYYGVPWAAEPSFNLKNQRVLFPCWFAVLLSATLAVAALMFGFTVRMLLLAMALAAVVLTEIVWALKK
jgi:hypothetical protein